VHHVASLPNRRQRMDLFASVAYARNVQQSKG